MASWSRLIDDWIRDTTLPLYVRKSSAERGVAIMHSSGRSLIPCDNTTAVWAYTLALQGQTPTLSEIAEAARDGTIPFAFTGLRGQFAEFYERGWKLAHIEGVGLGTRAPLQNLRIESLEAHFRKLVLPTNMFAVPKRWAGLGEVPEIVEAFRLMGTGGYELPPNAAGDGMRSPGRSSRANLLHRKGGSRGPDRSGVQPAVTYEATRLLFKAAAINPLGDHEMFQIVTPEGTFAMTKKAFETTFQNVAASASYVSGGEYSYPTTPRKALQFLLLGER